MKIKLALALSFLVGSVALAQEITPRWKLEPGKVHRFKQILKMSIDQKIGETNAPATNIDMIFMFSQKVVKVDDAGKATLEVTIEKIKQKVDNPMIKVEFDSEKPEDVERAQKDPQLKQVADMIGKTFKAEIDTRGVVHSVTSPPGPAVIPLEKADLQQMYLEFPEKAIKVGDSWTLTTKKVANGLPVTVENVYTLKGVEEAEGGRFAILSSVPKVTLHAKEAENPMVKELKMESFEGSGSVRFALDEGVLKGMKASNTMTLALEAHKLIQNIKTESTLELVPDAK